MEHLTKQKPAEFVDRRSIDNSGGPEGFERRQFSDLYAGLHPDAAELAEAVDQYKLRHRRRFITFEELLDVITDLGYHK